jgi:drug/metabolite transporter (DMT)-like permease
LSPRERRLLFWESFLGNFGFSICMLFGVAATSAVAAGVVMAAIPAVVAVMSWAFLGERITPRVRGAIVLAGAGIATLALAKTPSAPDTVSAPWWGYALLLGAVVCEASYVVIGKRLAASVSPQRISALINLWGLALITPFGLWQAWSFDFSSVDAPTWGLLVFYALAASVATVWLWMRGLRHVPASRAGIFTVCLPVSAAAVGVAWLGEPFGAAHAVAFALSLAGLLLATWPDQAPAASSSSSS